MDVNIYSYIENFNASLKSSSQVKMFGDMHETTSFPFPDSMNTFMDSPMADDMFAEQINTYSPAGNDSCSFYQTDYEPEGTGFEDFMVDSQPSPASTEASERDLDSAYEVIFNDVIESMCTQLRICQDPQQWTEENVKAFLTLMVQKCNKPEINLSNFKLTGTQLCDLTEEKLEQRAPSNGYFIHKCLAYLQEACSTMYFSDLRNVRSPYEQQMEYQPPITITCDQLPVGYSMQMSPSCTPSPSYTHTYNQSPVPSPAMHQSYHYIEPSRSPAHSISSGSSSGDESMPSPADHSGRITTMTPNHTGSIQLWQFLKELLLQPESYNYCIRFLDRQQGIFKIEDSVEVARLWGQRKNRPKMNYDKLSRSIRQYYKKGIMKKTDIAQRLVYQFVHPF